MDLSKTKTVTITWDDDDKTSSTFTKARDLQLGGEYVLLHFPDGSIQGFRFSDVLGFSAVVDPYTEEQLAYIEVEEAKAAAIQAAAKIAAEEKAKADKLAAEEKAAADKLAAEEGSEETSEETTPASV